MDDNSNDLQFIRCGVYTRQSVLRPGDPALASCSIQRTLCVEFIRSMAWRGWYAVAEHFDDEGFSGANIDRPGLEKLFRRIQEGDIKRVIVYRLDRLTRRLSDFALLVQLLEQYDVGLTIVQGSIDAEAGSLARLQLNMLATFAELERDLIAERLADARAAHKTRGERAAGRVPLGYRTDAHTKQLVIEPKEETTVTWFFAEAARGTTSAKLAAEANKLRLPTNSGKCREWSPRSVLRLLQNKGYTGRRPDGTPGVHAAIINTDLFEQVQTIIEGRRSRKPSKRAAFDPNHDPFILRGLLHCEKCGKIMTTSMSTALTKLSAKKAPRYYRCRTTGCAGQVAAYELEAMALEFPKQAAPNYPPPYCERLRSMVSAWDNLWPVTRRTILAKSFERMTWNTSIDALVVTLRNVDIYEF